MPQQIREISKRSKMPPSNWRGGRRVAIAPVKRSFFRRVLRWFFNGYTITLAVLVLAGSILAGGYFWLEYSDLIDRKLLSGQVFTPSAGIYSAPKTLRANEKISKNQLIDYLKSAGYIEKNAQADPTRSRFEANGETIKIEPGATAMIDGQQQYVPIEVKFGKDGESVATISDKDGNAAKDARIEPRILSSLAGEGDGQRKTVTFKDIPENLVKAITVTEDRSFFEHYGVNVRGVARALWRRYEGDDNSPIARQGGSSITQQLVKNLLLSNEYSLERKAKEAMMAVILETKLSKEEIFTLYANQIYLGQRTGVSIYGVGEASRVYFGKDVTQISLGECAFLAGIIRSPNRYNPFKNQEKVTERRNQVLESMKEAGAISDAEFAAAKNSPVVLNTQINERDSDGMPYFSQYVQEEIPRLVTDPEAVQHLRVYTSIDPDLQKIAYETVAKRLEKLDKAFPKREKGSLQAGLVAIRPKTGEIVAMVGGRNYLENQFNRATDAKRQPGSVFKPFVYASAINSGYDSGTRIMSAATVFKDEKKTFTFNNESYAPNNYGDFFSNKEVTLRDALVKSKNTITVDIAMQLNVGKVMNLAAKAGLPKVEKAYPSMSLGTAEATPLQVATGYTMFANLGDRVTPMPITRVTTGEGKTVVAPAPDKKNVLRPDVTYIVNDMMKDVINRGTATDAQAWGFKNTAGKTGIAGKTGTSRDGWFAGFTPELICVVYVGFDDGSDLGMKGGDSALPIWADFMRDALAIHPEWNGDWTMPANIRKAEIDIRDGKLIREINSLAGDQEIVNPVVSVDPETGEELPEPTPKFVTSVPAEFTRTEMFIPGTVPNRALIETPLEEQGMPQDSKPRPTPPPDNDAPWIDGSAGNTAPQNPPKRYRRRNCYVCPLSGLRATQKCPEKEARGFKPGTEPKEFCDLHR